VFAGVAVMRLSSGRRHAPAPATEIEDKRIA